MKLIIIFFLVTAFCACDLSSPEVTLENGNQSVDSLILEINEYTLKFHDIKPNTIYKKSFTENLYATHDVMISGKAYRQGILFPSNFKFNDLGYIPPKIRIVLKDSLSIY
jgi:hypothetical protein